MKTRWERYLSREISIKYKAGIYSLCHLFYCACYLIWQRTFSISLLQVAEIAFLSYLICNLQVYVLKNFDEAEKLTSKWWLSSLLCMGLYMLAVYAMNWFDGNIPVVLGFGIYQLYCYYCIYLINKIKRRIDSKRLNQLLDSYKNNKKERHYD